MSNVRAEREVLYVSTLRRSKIMPYLMFQCVSCVSERIEDTIQPREPFDYSTDAHEVHHYSHLFFGQMALLHRIERPGCSTMLCRSSYIMPPDIE